ncbi:hypothetical protein D3C80_1708260 [compost metagenome]
MAFKAGLSLFQQCLFGLQICLGDVQRRFGVAQIVALWQIVDVGNRLAFGDLVAKFDLQGFDLAGDLCPDVDPFYRIKFAGGQYGIFNIAQTNRRGHRSGLRGAL